MRKSNQKNNNSKEQGVALLFVILLTSVLLLVALGIANVAYKWLTFSLEARDSDKAFFAADTGIECALYLDKENFFDGSIHPFECAGATLIVPATTSPFQFVVPLGIECAEITVDKLYNPDGLSDGTLAHPFYTKISSVGYNANRVDFSVDPIRCIPLGTSTSRIVTRAISVNYPNSEAGTTGGGTTGGGATMDGTASPLITTVSATSVGPSTELLTGNLDDMGGATGMYVNFLYNEDATFTGLSYSSGTPLMVKTSTGSFSYTLTGLTCATTYDFEAWGNNTFVGMGANMTFTTAPCL